MALINTSVPNLIQGVSQQPDATRFDGQCEEQENALSSVAEGLKKRPNTRHIARLLESAIDANSFVHFVNRDDTEKYVIIHDGSSLRAYNIITGNEATINDSTGGYDTTAHAYLNTSSPRVDMEALTIADTTLLLNKEITTSTDSNSRTPELAKQAFVFIKQGDYGKNYSVEFGQGDTMRIDIVEGTYLGQAGPTPIGFIDATIASGGANYDPNTIYDITYTFYPDYGQSAARTLQAQTDSNGVVSGIRNVSTDPFETTIQVLTTKSLGGSTSDANYNFTYPQPNVSNEDSASFGTVTATTGNSTTASNSSTTAIINSLYLKSTNQDTTGNNTEVNDNFNVNFNGNGLLYDLKSDSDADDFSISTRDDLADSGMDVLYKEVDSLSSLPLRCINGFRVKIKGDADLNQDDYYVKFETADGSSWSQGSWVESVAPDNISGLDNQTLPHRLVNTGVDEFTIEEVNYETKTVGDSNSNPMSSFINNKISNMFFFKNRLGFLSNEHVIMSEAGHFYNFFRTTVTSLLDSDPIDVSVSSGRVTNLKAAKGFQENLVLFSDNSQFVLKGGDILTAKTVSITPITNFSFEDQVAPLPLGSYIYFPFTRGAFTGMREFTVNASTDNYDAAEVTEHVPAYIPRNIIDIAGSTAEDSIVLLSEEEKGSLYIYNYFWNNNQKVLSAWSKFTFTGEIRGVEFIESNLYMVITNNSETNLVEISMESGRTDDAGYITHLDNRVAAEVLNGDDTITLPYTPDDNSVEVYTTDGLALNCSNVGSTVTLSNPVAADTDVWVGVPYTMKYTFSEQLFKARAGNGKSPSNAAKMMIRNGSLYFDKSAFFKVKVTPKFRDTYENVFTPDVVGSTTLGSLNLDSGFYRFPVFTKPEDTTITIENDSALPSTFQSAEFESFVHSRSNRYG